MSFSLTVTAGATVSANTVVNAALLNALAVPSVSIADGTLPAAALDSASFITAFGGAFRSVNWLPWGSLGYDLFAAGTVSCPDGLRTENAKGWWVMPSGAAVDALRSARTSTNSSLEAGRAALQVKGAASLTAVRVGTWLPPSLTAQLCGGNMAFSVYVWNSTGSSITPSLEISTGSTAGDEGNVSLQSTVAGSACTNGAWTRVTFTFDASTITNFVNGARLGLKFTVASGQLDVNTDYVLIADAQIDKDATVATAFIGAPPVQAQVPAGTLFPYGGSTAPPGWLLCDGTAVSRSAYARLFTIIGTSYGAGDGSTTFNVPDMRGRAFVGAEAAGASQSRLEVSMSATGSSGASTLTVTSTAGLRAGMGVYGTGIATGTYITALTATTITLSAALTSSIAAATVRFGKLGPSADPESVGSGGNGMSYGRNEVKFQKAGCSTASSTTLTVPSLAGLACGMTVSSSAGDIPAGTVIDAFLSTTTVRLSAAATGTNSGITVTFGVDAPEGNQWEVYQYLQRVVKLPCVISQVADTQLQHPAGLSGLLETGMVITGPSGAGIQAGTYLSSFGSTPDFNLSQATSGATVATHDLTFTGATLSRAGTPTPDTLPAATGNWIIKS